MLVFSGWSVYYESQEIEQVNKAAVAGGYQPMFCDIFLTCKYKPNYKLLMQ